MKIKTCIPIAIGLMLTTQTALAASISDVQRFQQNDGSFNAYIRYAAIDTQPKNDLIQNEFGGLPYGGSLWRTGFRFAS